MTNYVKRLFYVDETNKINILFYPFLFATMVYGFGFAIFSWWHGVSTSSLFIAMSSIHPAMPHIWGLFALAAGVLAIVLILRRKRGGIGELAAMFGFLVWLFAGIIYIMNGYWLVLLSVTGPNMFFWAWYYTRVKWYERMKESGRLVDAG